MGAAPLSGELDRRFEAVLVDLRTGPPDAELRAAIDEARAAGLPVELAIADGAGTAEALARLGREGIAPALVVVVGTQVVGPLHGRPTHVDGGRAAVLAVLADQRERRRRGDVPEVDPDPEWTVRIDGLDPELERVQSTLLTIADGHIGTTGGAAGFASAAVPVVLASGVYVGEGPETELMQAPVWTELAGDAPRDALMRRRLDLRTGVLRQEVALPGGTLVSLRFSSLARPGVVALRADGVDDDRAPARPLRAPSAAEVAEGERAGRQWMARRAAAGGVTAAAVDARAGARLERLGAYATVAEGEPPPPDAALDALTAAEAAGFDALLSEHRAAWARRWERADVVIDGDPELQLAIRFALFQLMGAVASEGEAAVGARGLSGHAYRGHVFWDSDVFVLPMLAATHPPAARAMLEYRLRRLGAAREAARALNRRGARFPWESARDGFDVTPRLVRDRAGRIVRIRTGELEEHIVADVAWAATFYAQWSGDAAFAGGPARELLAQTARYWASRVRFDRDGRAHLYGVIGPDEYHEPVDDNAFTNVMARWNLRRAAETAVDATEREEWLRVADALVDGYDPRTGIYEQCASFHRLEPLIIADVAPRRPIAADLLLGLERLKRSQVVKQADVLMMHHLVPEEVEPGSLAPNLDYYEPRTAHGSSLSPAIHAGLHARARRWDDALRSLRIASQIDLDDLTRSTAGGLHVATMGGLWQALVFGFAGVRAQGERLLIDPRLPPQWRALEVRLCFRGTPLRVRVEHDGVRVDADGPLDWTMAAT